MAIRISPSAVEDWAFCPRFDSAPRSSNPRAFDARDTGIKLHKAVETGDLSGLTENERDQAQFAMNYVDKVHEEVLSVRQAGAGSICEERIVTPWPSPVLGKEAVISGYVDKTIYGLGPRGPLSEPLPRGVQFKEEECHVIEYKFGDRPVSPAGQNSQILLYAFSKLTEFPNLEQVTGHLVQPPLQTVSSHVFTRDETLARIRELDRQVQARFDPFSTPVVTSGLCERCCHIRTCPAYNGLAQSTAVTIRDPLVSSPKFISLFTTVPQMMSSWDRSLLRVALDVAEEAIAAKKKELADSAASGLDVPGYTVVHRKGNPTIVDPLLAREALRNAGITDDVINKASTITMTGLARETKLPPEKLYEILGPTVERGGPVQYLQRSRKFTLEALLKEAVEQTTNGAHGNAIDTDVISVQSVPDIAP